MYPRIFKLKFPRVEIAHWTDRYSYTGGDHPLEKLGAAARDRGYLRPTEFLALCRWKTARTVKQCSSNSAQQIQDATQLAFSTGDDRAKIGILRLLAGVDWATASVVLHFCDRQPYPILDFRALWSLGSKQPSSYTFDFWWAYTTFIRQLAGSTGHSMRTIDRAVWQYSKEHQPPRRRGVGCRG